MTFGIFGAQSASAAIPKVINYQSRLRNSGLSAITASTTIQFTIYNDLSAGSYTDPATAGGPLLWKEIHDGGACAKAQPDADGYFSVQLGACTAFPSYIDWNQPLYLGVQIESDPEASPRVLLAAFQYALNSDAVDTFSASSTAAADTLLALDSNLNFNILTGGFLGGYFTMSSTTANNGIAGNLSIAGNSIIGDSSADLVTVNGRFNSDLIPSLDLTYSLGSASNRWNAFLGNVTSVNVTSSNFFTDTLVATNGTVTNNFGVTNIVWTNATGTNTTSTNLFSTNFGATTATIQNLVLGSPLNLTNLTWVNGTGTNTTSTYFFANTSTIVSLNSTYGSFTELTIVNATAGTLNATTVTTTNLFVGGRAVCLEDGTNCLTSPETDSLLTVTNRGSVATATVTLFGGLVSANLTVTGTSNLQGTTFTNATGTNLVVTNVTSTNASSSNLQANIATFATATVSGQAICLSNGVGCPSTSAEADTLASVTNRGAFATSSVTLFGGLTVSNLTATGTTSLQNTTISNGTTTNFAVTGAVNSNLIPAADLAFSLGNATNRWNANLGNVTSTSVTTTNLFATNAFVDTLGVTTFSASSGTITNFLFANATGTNLFVTNFNAGTGSINNFTSNSSTITNLFSPAATFTSSSIVNLTATTATITNLVLGSPLNLTNITWVNATGTNTTSTNLFATTFGFTNATGDSLTSNIANINTLTSVNGSITTLTSTSGTIATFNFENATGSSLYASTIQATTVSSTAVFVNGVAVCLASGTNCPTGTTPNLQTVTNAGNTTTRAIQFAGGTSTADFVFNTSATVNGIFTANGQSNLQNVSFLNATGSSLFVSSLRPPTAPSIPWSRPMARSLPCRQSPSRPRTCSLPPPRSRARSRQTMRRRPHCKPISPPSLRPLFQARLSVSPMALAVLRLRLKPTPSPR
ncbi:hypothetical protein IPH19_03350 [Candidatus Uhrbacteria bacterium]|nr:MAG: hypothetical protein IPH19_03350 [Candidatus Uhrbacteria bacterium]